MSLDNILVGDENNLSTIKVADFGLSAKYEQFIFKSVEQQVGTLVFMAPEQLVSKKLYSRSVDIFAAGIIMYMLLTGGKHPLYDPRVHDTETYKEQLLQVEQFEFPGHFPFLTKNLFNRLTHFSVTQRYTVTEALKHPWITRINKTTIPMTFQEQINTMELERKLRTVSTPFSLTQCFLQKIGLMIFLGHVKKAMPATYCHLNFYVNKG